MKQAMNHLGVKRVFRVFLCLMLGSVLISAECLLSGANLRSAEAQVLQESIEGDAFYVGQRDARLHITKIDTYWDLEKVDIAFWRYPEGSEKSTAIKVSPDIVWTLGQPYPQVYNDFSPSETGQTYHYFIKATFYYAAAANRSPQEVEGPVMKQATPGKAWGEIQRDTLWDGDIELTGTVTVAELATLTIKAPARIRSLGDKYITAYGNLLADGVTFASSGTTSSSTYIYFKKLLSLKNCTFTDNGLYVTHSGQSSELIFQGNTGGSTEYPGSINLGSTLAVATQVTGNSMPGLRLALSSQQKGIVIDHNTFLSVSAIDCEGDEGTAVTIEKNSLSDMTLDNVPGVVVRENTVDNALSVKDFNGTGGAVIENNILGDIELYNCHQNEEAGIHLRNNPQIRSIRMNQVTGVTVKDNIMDLETTTRHVITLVEGAYNVIQNNLIRQSNFTGVRWGGIVLGLGGSDKDGAPLVADNQILGNRIVNFYYGIALGSAGRNILSGNSLIGNVKSILLGPYYRYSSDRQVTGTAYPKGNVIWNNVVGPPNLLWKGVNIQIDAPSEELQNTWNVEKTAGANLVGGGFLGGNAWSDYEDRYEEQDEDNDAIWDEPYVIDDRNQDNLPLVMPVGLTLSAGNLNPAKVFEFYGLKSEEDYTKGRENVVAAHVTLTASSREPWNVTGLTFSTSGTGNEREDILRARLYKDSVGGTLLGEALFDQDNGSLAFTFNPAMNILANQSVSFILAYNFRPERAFPCNDYRAIISTSGIAAAPAQSQEGKLFPLNGSVEGIIRVKPGVLVKKEGDNQYGEAKDPAINQPLAIPLKAKITWQHPATVDHVAYRIVSNPDFGAFLQQAKDEKKLLSEIPLNEEGYAEEIMTLGTKKGLKNPYLVEIEPVGKGAQCEAGPDPPFYTSWGLGLELGAASQYDNPADRTTFGTFLSTIQVDNKFTLTVQDMAPAPPDCNIKEVLFTLGANTVVATEVTQNQKYEAVFDMAALERPQKLVVTVKMEDAQGAKSEQQEEYDVKALQFPSWIDAVTKISESVTKEFSDEEGGTYTVTFNYPTNFIWSDYVPESVGLLGGLKNDLDIEFTASAKYRVNETSTFEATMTGQPILLGKEIGMEGKLSGEFDANFAFQRGTGNIASSVSFDLPSKGYSRTFYIYGVPVTAAVDLSGNVEVFVNGSAILNRQLEFEEIIIAPGTTVTGNITISLAAVFGLAKIAATGSPTVTMEIELKYTSASGTETQWRGQVVVPITVVGSIFWGVGSATLCETTLGPWEFGSGHTPQAYRPLEVAYPSSPRLLSSSALAADTAGQRMSVWIDDTRPEEASTNPDVFFRYNNGTAAPVIGAASPNSEWETDPAVVFMGSSTALACWTANKGDKSLNSLNAILAAQDIACAVWNGTAWGGPVKIIDDDQADGTVSLAYDPALDKSLAVWVHNADPGKSALNRTAWKLLYSLYDPQANGGAGGFSPARDVTGTNTGKADQMPVAGSDGSGNVLLIWARDDDGVFHAEMDNVTNGTNVDAKNLDSHILWSKLGETGWTEPVALATGGEATRVSPSLAPAPGGSFLAVWSEKDPSKEEGKKRSIRYAVYSGGAWSSPGVVVEGSQFMEDPKAVVDATGKATVLWRGYAAGGKSALFSSTGAMAASITWSEPQQITHDDTVQWQPAAVVGPDNKVITSWNAYDARTGKAQSGSGLSGGLNVAASNPGTADLAGTYSAQAMDADSDSVYESLNVSVGVHVIVAGSYKVLGDLYAGAKFIGRAEVVRNDLATGAQTFVLVFPGGVLSNRGLDGPYSLKNVVVLDLKDSAIQTAFAAAPIFATQAHQASHFIPGPLRLDQPGYRGTAARAIVTVREAGANLDPSVKDQLTVQASSTKNGKGFSVILEETGVDTGVFSGSVGFSTLANDLIQRNLLVADHDQLTVVYTDARGYPWTQNALWRLAEAGIGDLNTDDRIDLTDAVIAIQFMTGTSPNVQVNPLGMIDSKGKITIKEVIFILQKTAGMR